MMIAGHATSISLEPVFWDALREAAAGEGVPLNALVARIDVERLQGDGANLASAIRVWLSSWSSRPSSYSASSRRTIVWCSSLPSTS